MTDEKIELDELEFKAEDFSGWAIHPDHTATIEAVVNRANALLRERLAKAPVVLLVDEDELEGNTWIEPGAAFPLSTTAAARLVCVRKLGEG